MLLFLWYCFGLYWGIEQAIIYLKRKIQTVVWPPKKKSVSSYQYNK